MIITIIAITIIIFVFIVTIDAIMISRSSGGSSNHHHQQNHQHKNHKRHHQHHHDDYSCGIIVFVFVSSMLPSPSVLNVAMKKKMIMISSLSLAF